MEEGTLFSIPPPAFVICGFINDGHSDWGEVVSHGSFDVHFSNNQGCGAFFHVFVGHLYDEVHFISVFSSVVHAFVP